MIDLRKEFEKVLNEYGYPILFIRKNKKQECSCVNQLYQTGDTNCPICLGTGYINSVEKLVTRDTDLGAINQLKSTSAGDALVKPVVYYLKYDVRPCRDDLIVNCSWDGDIPIIDEYTHIYRVDNAIALKGDSGRIEYFKCVAENCPVNESIKLFNIIKNEKEVKYYITVKD